MGGFRHPRLFRSWILAYLGYALAVHMCDGWGKFGGFIAQMSFISAVLRIAVVENPGEALIYARRVAARIEKLARDRDARAEFSELLRFESSGIRAKAVRENASGLEDVARK